MLLLTNLEVWTLWQWKIQVLCLLHLAKCPNYQLWLALKRVHPITSAKDGALDSHERKV